MSICARRKTCKTWKDRRVKEQTKGMSTSYTLFWFWAYVKIIQNLKKCFNAETYVVWSKVMGQILGKKIIFSDYYSIVALGKVKQNPGLSRVYSSVTATIFHHSRIVYRASSICEGKIQINIIIIDLVVYFFRKCNEGKVIILGKH